MTASYNVAGVITNAKDLFRVKLRNTLPVKFAI